MNSLDNKYDILLGKGLYRLRLFHYSPNYSGGLISFEQRNGL
jgi:hypothetical protein